MNTRLRHLALLPLALLSFTLTGTATHAADKPAILVHSTLPGLGPRVSTFLGGVVEKLGGTVAQPVTALTPETLAGKRLLVVANNPAPFSADELAAVHAFVRAGGSLLVVTDEDRRNPRSLEVHQPLLEPYGLRFTPDTAYAHNVGAVAEPGPINSDRREIPYSGGRAVTGGTPFSFVMDTNRVAHAAYVELPSGGRVVAMAEMMAALGMGDVAGERLSRVSSESPKNRYWGKDANLFMTEVLAWLLRTATTP